MATYAFKGRGAALPYDAFGFAVLKRNIDLATLVATDYGKLALAATPTVGLTSFSGFVQNDILEVWEVPAGTLLMQAGVRVTTAEGATAAAEMGYNSATQTKLGIDGSAADPDAYIGAIDLNSTTSADLTAVADPVGPDNVVADLYETAGSIDIKFTTDDTYAVAVFDVWAIVAKVY